MTGSDDGTWYPSCERSMRHIVIPLFLGVPEFHLASCDFTGEYFDQQIVYYIQDLSNEITPSENRFYLVTPLLCLDPVVLYRTMIRRRDPLLKH